MKVSLTCADGVLDGRTLVESDLVIAADGADGTSQRRAQNGRKRSGRTLAANRVLRRRTGASSAPSVSAQLASHALRHRHQRRIGRTGQVRLFELNRLN